MLQEITNRIHGFLRAAQERLVDLFYDTTLGLLKGYCDKGLELAKISAAICYIHAAKLLRQAAMLLAGAVTVALVFSIALVLTPMLLVMLSPWSVAVKMVWILALGLFFLVASAVAMSALFSEERWMKFTQSSRVLEKLTGGPS